MSKNERQKMFLRDSLVGWLGEFVALNKTPDCRLSSASQQFLNEAILEERQRTAESPRHLRSVSTQTAVLRLRQRLRCHNGNKRTAAGDDETAGATTVCHARHVSLPCGGQTPQVTSSSPRLRRFLPQRFRRGGRNPETEETPEEFDRTKKSAISELDENDDAAATANR
uniref:Uncharacterized protein n=1 Tax=Globodera pallida TaxID=36090 RepID=A0A183BNT1_GLOPA